MMVRWSVMYWKGCRKEVAMRQDEVLAWHSPECWWSGGGGGGRGHTPEHATQAYRGSRGTATLILNLGTRWRSMLAWCPGHFTSGKRTLAPIKQQAECAPQPVHTSCRTEIPLPPARIQTLDHPARNITILTTLTWLHIFWKVLE